MELALQRCVYQLDTQVYLLGTLNRATGTKVSQEHQAMSAGFIEPSISTQYMANLISYRRECRTVRS